MNRALIVILLSFSFAPTLLSMDQLAQNKESQDAQLAAVHHQSTQAEIDEFEAQKKSKNQAALCNRLQEQDQQTRADAALACQLSEQENGQFLRHVQTASQDADTKIARAKKTEDEQLKDAFKILFELQPQGGDNYVGMGLPKELRKLVFDNLRQMQHAASFDTRHEQELTCVAGQFDQANKFHVVSGSQDQTLRVWNGETQQLVHTLADKSWPIRVVATHRDALILVHCCL